MICKRHRVTIASARITIVSSRASRRARGSLLPIIARQYGADRRGVASARPTTTTAGRTHEAAIDQHIARAGCTQFAECDFCG
jgi:hypothetical protein